MKPVPKSPHIGKSFGLEGHEIPLELVATLRARVREEMIGLAKLDGLIRSPPVSGPPLDLRKMREGLAKHPIAKDVSKALVFNHQPRKNGQKKAEPEEREIEGVVWVNVAKASETMKCSRGNVKQRALNRNWSRRRMNRQVFFLKDDVEAFTLRKRGRHAVRA